MRSRHSIRIILTLSATTLGLLAAAGPAHAHGAGAAGPEVPNYVTTITEPGHPQLQWGVDIAHAKIELTNTTGQTVVVYGYRAEPYLRFDPDGATWWNAASPTSYLNRDRYGDAEIPPTATPTAEADWQPLNNNGSYSWYDHRAHWMAREPPEAVAADPTRRYHIDDWAIPLSIGDTESTAAGLLEWEPDRPWWPPILILTIAMTGAVALSLFVSEPAGDRWPQPAQLLAGLISLVAAANVIRGVDEAVTVADTAVGGAVVAVSVLFSAAVVAGLAYKGRAGHEVGYAGLLAAAFLAAVIFGGRSWTEIADPQIVTGLPAAIRRWSIAASYAIVIPATVAAFVTGRRNTRAATTSNPTANTEQ